MHCQEAFDLMSADLDGQDGVDPAARAGANSGLGQHLAGCPSCRARQAELGLIDGHLRALRHRLPAAPPALRARITRHCLEAHHGRRAGGCQHAQLAPVSDLRPRSAPRPATRARSGQRTRTAWGMALTGAAAALFALVTLGPGRPGALPGVNSGASAPGASRAVAAAGGEACQVAVSGASPVALACAAQGRPGARQVMERLTELARSRGLNLTCASCHLDERGFLLVDGAREKFASLLEATRT